MGIPLHEMLDWKWNQLLPYLIDHETNQDIDLKTLSADVCYTISASAGNKSARWENFFRGTKQKVIRGKEAAALAVKAYFGG